MNVRLKGYFDRNFGDDIMQRLVVEGLDEHTFYIEGAPREMLAHITDLPNVRVGPAPADSVLIYAVGTGFMYNSKRSRAAALLGGELFKKKNNVRSAVAGCSVEPFTGRMAERFTRRIISFYDYISCRDAETYEYLRGHIKNAKILCYPDMVFSLADKLPPKKRPHCLGIAPVARAYAADNYDYYSSLAAAADMYVSIYDRQVLLFALDSGMENDVSACLAVRQLMKRGSMAEIVIYDSAPEKIILRMTECERFITSRFHGAVAAMMLGIPVFAMYDRKKLEQLLSVYGISGARRGNEADKAAEFIANEQKAVVLPDDTAALARRHITELKRWIESI